MSETRVKARALLAAAGSKWDDVAVAGTPSGYWAVANARATYETANADAALIAAAPGLLDTLCTEGDALESKVNALQGEVRDEWIRRQTVERDRDSARAERDAAVATNVQLTATVEQLQREKKALEASLADAQQQYAATTTERLVLLSTYAMNYGAIKVTEEFALQYPAKVSTCRRGGVYEVIGGDLPNDFPSRLGTLVLLAVRRVTATASADDTYALRQALACPAICAADPVKLGTAATELADLVDVLRYRSSTHPSPRDTRAEELTRCCRMLIPLLDEATQREVIRRMEGSVEPTRVRTHDRDCLCQRCLDEAGRGR